MNTALAEMLYQTVVIKNPRNRLNIAGCTEAEVVEISRSQNVVLPALYREFLLKMGHSQGRIYEGTEFFYPDLLELKDLAEDMTANGPFHLPDDAFVFSMHQGYEFFYFRTSEDPDFPVYYYLEGAETSVEKCRSLRAFLLATIAEYFP